MAEKSEGSDNGAEGVKSLADKAREEQEYMEAMKRQNVPGTTAPPERGRVEPHPYFDR